MLDGFNATLFYILLLYNIMQYTLIYFVNISFYKSRLVCIIYYILKIKAMWFIILLMCSGFMPKIFQHHILQHILFPPLLSQDTLLPLNILLLLINSLLLNSSQVLHKHYFLPVFLLIFIVWGFICSFVLLLGHTWWFVVFIPTSVFRDHY